jgi:sarcosine oxidase subunit beta
MRAPRPTWASHIIQNCEVTGIRRAERAVTGVETSRGFIGAKKVGVVAAGHTSVIMEMAGVRMPLESYPLQALVSEPVKPAFPAWSCRTPCTPISPSRTRANW